VVVTLSKTETITVAKRHALWKALGGAAVFAAIAGAWMLSLPAVRRVGWAPPIGKDEDDATIDALKPSKRHRPLIAIVGANDGTEVTDYLMPYGILKRADVAELLLLGTQPGPVRLYPALRVEPDATLAEFDARHPEGADYVIVPAMRRDNDPAVLQWIKSQAARGALVIGVCAGAKIIGAAGLLDGKRATTHWYYVKELRARRPAMVYVADRRLVVDRGVATTTGITASMPLALTLIAAIAGRAKADAVARDLGLTGWDLHHESAAFEFTRPFASTAIRNRVTFWNHERLGLELMPGVDEVSLALVVDAWSRTYRSRVVTFSGSAQAQESRYGVRLLPDRVTATSYAADLLSPIGQRQPARALAQTLDEIAERYGVDTAEIVAMQLEYSWRAPSDETWRAKAVNS
jgi:putative intracellular protease/amidase